jgi:hypothetical protein
VSTTGSIELIRADLVSMAEMLHVLEKAAEVNNVTDVKITFQVSDGDFITVGYGESGDPAVIAVEPAR